MSCHLVDAVAQGISATRKAILKSHRGVLRRKSRRVLVFASVDAIDSPDAEPHLDLNILDNLSFLELAVVLQIFGRRF